MPMSAGDLASLAAVGGIVMLDVRSAGEGWCGTWENDVFQAPGTPKTLLDRAVPVGVGNPVGNDPGTVETKGSRLRVLYSGLLITTESP